MKDDEIIDETVSNEVGDEPALDMGSDMGDVDDVVFEESDEAGGEGNFQQKIKKLKEKIATLEKEKQEYLDGWQRSRADYANLIKTNDDDKKRVRTMIEENFVEELTGVVDSFSMAMSNKEAWQKVDPNWRTGVEYIYQQLMNVLKGHNFSDFGAIGDVFNPTLHEAVSETETTDASLEHTISTVLQKGYKLGDSILRPARVSVYKVQ